MTYMVNSNLFTLTVPDLSCASVANASIAAAVSRGWGSSFIAYSCTTDPIGPASTVWFGTASNPKQYAQSPWNFFASVDPAAPLASATVNVNMPSIFDLDPSGASLIAGAILAVWALGFGIRTVIRALSIDGKSTSESES